MQLTPHFHLHEFTRSQTAARKGISNIPNNKQVAHLRRLCETVLEPLREIMGREIHVTSGYRCRKLNAAVGSDPTSMHRIGMAADIVMSGMTARNLGQVLKLSDIQFDKLIVEFDSWVHVAIRAKGKPRRETMVARREAGRTVYRLVHQGGSY